MKTAALLAFASTLVLSSVALAASSDDSSDEDAPKKKATPAPAAAPAAPSGKSDHDMMIGHLAVGYMGASQIPIAQFGGGNNAPSAGSVTAPFIGARYWLNQGMGIDVGLGLAYAGSSSTLTQGATSTTTDQPSVFGFGLHGGVPLALASAEHFSFQLTPELNFGYASSTIRAVQQQGQPVQPDINQSGMRLDLGARVGGEVHFGFMGVPQLSLQASVGLGLRYSSISASASDNSFSFKQGGPAFGTSVQDAPWAIFTNNIQALYYF